VFADASHAQKPHILGGSMIDGPINLINIDSFHLQFLKLNSYDVTSSPRSTTTEEVFGRLPKSPIVSAVLVPEA
jgi:hypothetical protein